MRTRLLTALALALVLLLPRPAAADLLVSSNHQEVLRYDGSTGAFLGAFVPAGSGGLDEPRRPDLRPRRQPLRRQLSPIKCCATTGDGGVH